VSSLPRLCLINGHCPLKSLQAVTVTVCVGDGLPAGLLTLPLSGQSRLSLLGGGRILEVGCYGVACCGQGCCKGRGPDERG